MTDRPWWLGMPPIDAEADCQGTLHALRWERGELTPLDHIDPEGERLLIALGGEASGCLELVTSWDQHSRDVRFLAAAPRSSIDRLSIAGFDLAEVGRHLTNIAATHRGAWPRRAVERLVALDPQRVDAASQRHQPFAFRSLGLAASVMAAGEAGWRNHVGLLELFTMPRALLDRLQLEIWAARSGDLRDAIGAAEAGRYSRERPALLAAAFARVRAAVIGWLAPPSSGPDPEVAVHFTPDASPLRLSRAEAGEFVAEVGTDWVSQVFGRQMSQVERHLVLELVDLTERTARVWALRPPPAPWSPGLVPFTMPVLLDLARRADADAWGVVAGPE